MPDLAGCFLAMTHDAERLQVARIERQVRPLRSWLYVVYMLCDHCLLELQTLNTQRLSRQRCGPDLSPLL
jgi:hypothetical protein